jgi:hypothetical protein
VLEGARPQFAKAESRASASRHSIRAQLAATTGSSGPDEATPVGDGSAEGPCWILICGQVPDPSPWTLGRSPHFRVRARPPSVPPWLGNDPHTCRDGMGWDSGAGCRHVSLRRSHGRSFSICPSKTSGSGVTTPAHLFFHISLFLLGGGSRVSPSRTLHLPGHLWRVDTTNEESIGRHPRSDRHFSLCELLRSGAGWEIVGTNVTVPYTPVHLDLCVGHRTIPWYPALMIAVPTTMAARYRGPSMPIRLSSAAHCSRILTFPSGAAPVTVPWLPWYCVDDTC